MKNLHRISLVIVILALIGGTTGCGAATPVLTPTSTLIPTKTHSPTATNITTIEPLPSATIFPIPIETVNPINGIEVIVYSWDGPNIPSIHIWKNGRAIWVIYADNLIHVYETYLSQDEIIKVQDVLSTSGFWEDAQPEATFTPASWLFLWASTSFQRGVVAITTSEIRNVLFTPLQNILESSPQKREYFPDYGYLFISYDGEDSIYGSKHTYYWPDDKVSFKFETTSKGIYVDGEILSMVWEAFQENAIWIASQNNIYQFELKIPGVSCVISYEPYMCNIYTAEEQ